MWNNLLEGRGLRSGSRNAVLRQAGAWLWDAGPSVDRVCAQSEGEYGDPQETQGCIVLKKARRGRMNGLGRQRDDDMCLKQGQERQRKVKGRAPAWLSW